MPPRYVFLEETFLPSLPTLQPLDLYRRTLACLVLAVSCLGGGGLWADDARTSIEQRSNAVSQVLLGIFSYVRWPKEPAVLQLCVVGPTEYADGLLRGMVQANGRRVHAERRAVDNPDLGTLCNVIYLGVVDERERQQVFRSLAGARLREEDILLAARETQGLERMEQIRFAILEKNGKISIIPDRGD